MKLEKKNCVLCGSIMISHQEICSVCREKDRMLKVYGCFLPKEEPDFYIRCPKCGSSHITASGIIQTFGIVCVNTGEIDDMDWSYEGNPRDDFNEFYCNGCDHEWEKKKSI